MDMKSRSIEHGPEPTSSLFSTCGCGGHTTYALYLDPPDGWQNNLPRGFGHYLVSMIIVRGPSSHLIQMAISCHQRNCPSYGQPEIQNIFPPSLRPGPGSPSGRD